MFSYIFSNRVSVEHPDACQKVDKHLSCKLLPSLLNLAVPAIYGAIFGFVFENSNFCPWGDGWCRKGQLTAPERREEGKNNPICWHAHFPDPQEAASPFEEEMPPEHMWPL